MIKKYFSISFQYKFECVFILNNGKLSYYLHMNKIIILYLNILVWCLYLVVKSIFLSITGAIATIVFISAVCCIRTVVAIGASCTIRAVIAIIAITTIATVS